MAVQLQSILGALLQKEKGRNPVRKRSAQLHIRSLNGQEFRQPMEAPSNRESILPTLKALGLPCTLLLQQRVNPNAGIVTFLMQKTNPPYAVQAYHFSR